MKIGLSFTAVANKGGIGHYTRLLALHLPKIFPQHDYIGYVPSFRELEIRQLICRENILGWNINVIPSSNRWIFETRALPSALSKDPPDLFHGPDYIVPEAACPLCVTVHDLAFLLYPKGMNLKSRFLFRSLAPKSIKRAARSGTLFCDSESTLKDLRDLALVNPDDGIVVYLACEDDFREPVGESRIEEIRKKYNLPEQYVLYVGPIEHRKNLGVLVQAYKITARVLQKRDYLVPALVAAGPLGAGGAALVKRYQKQGDGLFVYLGYIPRDELRALYAGSIVFCYPSLYEGFGLPPLEAMCSGKAVICSNRSSLPEIVGGAGILVDPNDVSEWSTSILRILTNEKYRSEIESACRIKSGQFSIEKMCREVMAGYEYAVSKRK